MPASRRFALKNGFASLRPRAKHNWPMPPLSSRSAAWLCWSAKPLHWSHVPSSEAAVGRQHCCHGADSSGADDGKSRFFIRVGIGCKSFTCAVDDCGDDNDRHEDTVDRSGCKHHDERKSESRQSLHKHGANCRLLPGTKNADPRYAWGALLGHGYHRTLRPWLATEVSGRDIDGGRRLLVRDTDRHLRHVAANFYLSRMAYSAVGPLYK